MIGEDNKSQSGGSKDVRRISIRVPAYSYVAAMFVGTFFSALSFYLEFWIPGYVLLAAAWLVVPVLASTDRIVFNGKRLYRSGILTKIWSYLLNKRFWLKVKDIEQAETRVTPTLKRGGRVYYKYSTVIRGRGVDFTFSSGSRGYRDLVRSLFAALPEEILDSGSIELRDYAAETHLTRIRARQSDIPPADVLENAFRHAGIRSGRASRAEWKGPAASEEKASALRVLGNQLRLSGSLLQALESFRRAASISPNDAWLLFDFARCIQFFAGSEGDSRLERKAAAMMRLAERRAGNDGRLLARLGESYFQLGEWERSRAAFAKAADAVGEHFRAIRGMAEIALRDGKLAHVVHNFSAASRLAESPAARRWSMAEAEYFTRLSNDEEYLEMELGRVNLLDALYRWRGITLRLCFLGFPFIALGLFFDDAVTANCGWTLSGGTLALWTIIGLATRAFAPRISPELLQED